MLTKLNRSTLKWYASNSTLEKIEAYVKSLRSSQDSYVDKLSSKLRKYKEKFGASPHKSSNFKPHYILLHHTYGGWSSLWHWLRDKRSKVSYHYAVNTDGKRVQFVWDSQKAWHAGVSKWKGSRGMNTYSFGLAWTGDTLKRNPTFEELDSMAELCLYLIKKHKWEDRDLEGLIIRHEDVAPKRKVDCAKEWRTALIKRIKERQSITK